MGSEFLLKFEVNFLTSVTCLNPKVWPEVWNAIYCQIDPDLRFLRDGQIAKLHKHQHLA